MMPIATSNLFDANQPTNSATAAKGLAAKPAALKQISKEFEAVLCASMLKDGLKTASLSLSDEGETDKGKEMFSDFAYEQMAYHIGQQGVLGISDSIAARLNEPLRKAGNE